MIYFVRFEEPFARKVERMKQILGAPLNQVSGGGNPASRGRSPDTLWQIKYEKDNFCHFGCLRFGGGVVGLAKPSGAAKPNAPGVRECYAAGKRPN